jgi:hypothetical protein
MEMVMAINRIYRGSPVASPKEPCPTSGLPALADPFLRPNRAFTASVLLACLVSLIESRWEIVGLDTSTQLLALGASKLIIIALASASILGPSWVRVWFVFVSGAGLLAVAPTLPSELAVSAPIFWMSVFECFTKLAVVTTYVNWQVLNLKGPGHGIS